MGRYFPGQSLRARSIQRNAFLRQRREIIRLFGYRFWSDPFLPHIQSRAAELAMRDVTPAVILAERIALLRQEKMVRPGYNTLQAVISEALSAERRRLSAVVEKVLDRNAKAALKQLLVRDDALSELAEVQQDAKNFGYRMMALEREKRAAIAPLFRVAKEAVPKLEISQQNAGYYASLATYYTIHDLRRLKPEQTHLYLLCYAKQRYRPFTDHLADAFDFHRKQIEDATKEASEQHFNQVLVARQRETPRVGRLLLLYVDEDLDDDTPFGSVRVTRSTSFRRIRFGLSESAGATSPSVRSSYGGRRWTSRLRAARSICDRWPWIWTSPVSRPTAPGWRPWAG